MQIVINMDDNEYAKIKEDSEKFRSKDLVVPHLYKVIESGVLLPKGHGRLYDLDAALECIEEVADRKSSIKECAIGLFDWACSKRVVLEADKEE